MTVCQKYDIRHDVDTSVASHFNMPADSLDGNLEIISIQQPR